MKRRNLLKKGSSLLAATSLSTVGTAKERKSNFDQKYDAALKAREKTGSQEVFHRVLKNNGLSVNRKRDSVVFTENKEGVSTSDITKSEFTVDMTMSTSYKDGDAIEAAVDYYFKVATKKVGTDGGPGPDEMTIGWPDWAYRIKDYTWYSDSDSPNLVYKSSETNGLRYHWKDNAACPYGCSQTKYNYYGCKLKPLKTNKERFARGEIRHTWQEAEFGGFGVSASGDITFNIKPSNTFWEGKYITVEEM